MIQNDGKIIATGSGRNVFALARYNTNGGLNPEFSGDGKVSTDFVPNGFFQQASALALQPDGKIIAGGYAGSRLEDVDFALARYNPDGSLDTGFGDGGKVLTDFSAFSSSDLVWALALQKDGKIIAAGSSNR